jgi:beta-glucosidase
MLARILLILLAVTVAHADDLPFRNPDLPIDQRVHDLLGRLSVQEKIGLLGMKNPAIPRLGIPAYHWWNEGLHGYARSGTATVFPQAIALAATWDPDLEHKIADVISTEARVKNNQAIAKNKGDTAIYQGLTIWSPNVNIFRDPRWGRGQETYGEDPFLTGRMAVAFVEGLQGDDPHYLKTVATVKHFCVHSGPEELRHKFDAAVSERDLHETYLPAFEAGIREGHAQSLMSAYNAVNGVPMPANKPLLTDLLRGEWGFTGAVVGDVDTVGDIFGRGSHHYVDSAAEASALAIKAGNDLCSGSTYSALPDALKRGLCTEADIDLALRRLLTLRFKLGQFDPPERVPYRSIPDSELDSPAHAQLALQAAREALVLLKNDGSLPWDVKSIKTLAVLGPTADDHSALVGNYNGTPSHPITILDGLRKRLEPLGVKVDYSAAIPLVNGFRENGHALPDGVLFTSADRKTAGLCGEVFDNATFSGQPTATRTDAQVNFSWQGGKDVAGIPAHNAHLRWTGVLVPDKTGDYALAITFVGVAQLYLDDKAIAGEVKAGDPGSVRTRSAGVHLEAGHAYAIKIEFNQGESDSTGRITLGWRGPGDLDAALAQAAVADHIILTLGITPGLEGEEMKISADGFSHGDRTSVLLPQVQRDLIDKVAALHKPFIVVLTNGSPLSFDVTKPNGVLDAWYYGESGGQAVAEAIVGDINPGGHLPLTFYKSDSDLPAFTDYSMKNRTYRYFTGTPLFPFGYGLSFTTFQYENVASTMDDKTIKLDVKVKNTGSRDGDAVVQVYANAVHPPVSMPREWLVGFARHHLAAGESGDVSIGVPRDRLRRWDDHAHHFVVDPGSYQFRIGSSSADTPLTTDFQIQ